MKKVKTVSVTRVYKEEIGFRSAGGKGSRHAAIIKNLSNESQMLTRDESIIDINFDVQWVIKDPVKFLFKFRDLPSESTVKFAAESAIREFISISEVSEVLAEERYKIEQKVKTILQEMLDLYETGILIDRLQLLKVEPTAEVIDAYRDVQTAKADKTNQINQAIAHRNTVIPNARGMAAEILQEAESYKERVIANAKGEAERFEKVYGEYKKYKDVTTKSIIPRHG